MIADIGLIICLYVFTRLWQFNYRVWTKISKEPKKPKHAWVALGFNALVSLVVVYLVIDLVQSGELFGTDFTVIHKADGVDFIR
uniref:Uncharacterized protein n=1 Tax=viral metagenome TaxID=1070528 RepID=A0A6M3L5K8_9ZZZZ